MWLKGREIVLVCVGLLFNRVQAKPEGCKQNPRKNELR